MKHISVVSIVIRELGTMPWNFLKYNKLQVYEIILSELQKMAILGLAYVLHQYLTDALVLS